MIRLLELEAIYQTAPIGLCVLDADLRYVRINERLAEINGIPAADHIGRTVRELLPHIADEVESLLHHILETGEAVLDVEVTGETPARPGVARTWVESWFPLTDSHGSTVGINVVAEEVTERKRAERALRELTGTLAERVETRTTQVRELASALTLAEQTERRRVAEILHDGLQQQLYGAQLPLKMLEDGLQEAGRPDLLENVARANHYVAEAIETARHLMVDLSPPVLGGGGLDEALQWLVFQMEEQFGLHVELEGGEGLPVPSDDMRVLLFQTVRELLFNVVKHAGTDRAHVSLREEGPHLVIGVDDVGAGFDLATVEQRSPNATGLGIRRARERLSLFGGRLEATSQPGEGTRVTITVPTDRL